MLPQQHAPHVREEPDIEAVAETAALLDVGEFDVFMLAYKYWHGERPAERMIERPFMRQLNGGACPAYVRHFTRLVRLQAERGRLDRTEYGLSAPAPESMPAEIIVRLSLALYAGTIAAIFFMVPMLGGGA